MTWQLTVSGHHPDAEVEAKIMAACENAVRVLGFQFPDAVSYAKFGGNQHSFEWPGHDRIVEETSKMTEAMLTDIFKDVGTKGPLSGGIVQPPVPPHEH